MKYVFSLLLGLIVGAVLLCIGVLYNPFVSNRVISPLSVTDARTITLGYSAVPADSVLLSNDGLSRKKPYPEDVLQLWERPIRQSELMATVLYDARNRTAGIGIKVSSLSESTRLLQGEAIIDSVWYINLPGQGSLFIEQSENYWDYVREIVVPAYRSSANMWKGNWLGNITAGPGALQTARVSGGTGQFADLEMAGLETLTIKSWSAEFGTASADGRLIIELPSDEAALADDETAR